MLFLILFEAVMANIFLNVEVIIGITSLTPKNITQAIDSLQAQENSFSFTVLSAETITSSQLQNAFFVIDLTYSILYSIKLSKAADDVQIPFMSLYKASSNSPENHYYFHPSVEDATDSIQTLLNYFLSMNFMSKMLK